MSERFDPYAEIPYESISYPSSHPDNLAVIATLFGMNPPRLSGARVLEIGCASGGNLLPLALAWPGSQFVGIDLSARQIQEAHEAVGALGLENISFHALGLEALEEADGSFDYILAHGVYSWVAEPVREALMALCGRLLSAHGVAYISFNTLPGSSTRAALRDMLKFHTKSAMDEAGRLEKTRAFFGFMQHALQDRPDPYSRGMAEELAKVAQLGDFYVRHEHLEETNEPCYFHEFIHHAGQHGLQFLGEAEIRSMSSAGFPAPVRTRLREMSGSVEEAEQYGDFIRNRAFRQTLLCRSGKVLKRSITTDLLRPFHIASGLEEIESAPGSPARFRDADGVEMDIRDPLTESALLELRAVYPMALPFADLLPRALQRSRVSADARTPAVLAAGLLSCYSTSRDLELQREPRRFHPVVSDFPTACPLARWQSSRGPRLSNLRHENVLLQPDEQAFLQRLDGTQARATLQAAFPEATALLDHFARIALLIA